MVEPATIRTGVFLWRLVRPVSRIKKALNKRRARKGKEPLEVNEQEDEKVGVYNKAIVAAVGGVLAVLSRWVPGLEGTDAAMLVEGVVLIVTAFGVYQVPNAVRK